MVRWITGNADIVALQEVWCRQPEWSTAFASHGWSFTVPPRESHILGLFGSGLAVAWRSSAWTLKESRFYPYMSTVGFDVFAVKGWFRTELRCLRTQRRLRLINTHKQSDYDICDCLWRSVTESVRMAQALQLAEVEGRLPAMQTLIVGDLNTETCWFPGCAILQTCKDVTYPGTDQILDHCVSPTPWRIRDHRVVINKDWSDHYPVFYDLIEV